MISTANKIETLRTAVAHAELQGTPEVIARLWRGETPKGNALEIARTAGVMAAKRTWELIPYCHPIGLDQVTIDFVEEGERITTRATVTAIGRTGVEMEAITAAMVAALTLYDMGKAIDATMTITNARLVEKRGGKSDWHTTIPPDFRAAVIVTSDGTAAGRRADTSGRLIEERLRRFGLEPASYRILPDDRSAIETVLRQSLAEHYHLILTTGGTGLGPRDVTVEATRAVIEREVPGIAEAMRAHGQRRTPYAMLSRGVVGVAGQTVIVNLPGSSRGVKEGLDALLPALFHIYPMLRGGAH